MLNFEVTELRLLRFDPVLQKGFITVTFLAAKVAAILAVTFSLNSPRVTLSKIAVLPTFEFPSRITFKFSMPAEERLS